ncbi:hypothetical protein FPV67DRAFT_1201951 [Lyophyllum atratum]|nr:hypothetical protein FPV67DRAFT_1201951 [Lyophyllum atratum]
MVSILRRRRNALSLISRLPSEILCRIFEIARDQDETHKAGPWMCISISQVCSAWRNTAMHFQGMWSSIHCYYKLEWVKELLVRSGTGPLQVHLDALAWGSESMLPFVFSDAASKRFQELDLCGFSPLRFESQFQSIFGGHAPLLETLSILFDYRHESIMRERLFSEGTPRLRTLSLQNCPLPWNAPLLKSPLIHLKLVLPRGAAAMRWTMTQITAVLENLPALRDLVLCHVLAAIETSTTPVPLPRRHIPLLYLEDLSIIADNFSLCTYLLDRLSLTPTPFICLDGSSNEPQNWTLQSVIDSLSPIRDMLHLQHSVDTDPSPGPLRSAFFTSDYANCMSFSAWSNVEPTPQLYGKPVIKLSLPGHAEDLLAIPSLMTALPLRGLQKIMFHHDIPKEWLQALGPLEHVHTVSITDVRQVSSSILKWLAQESSAPVPQFPLHALSRLEIIGRAQNSGGGIQSAVELLKNVLMSRHRHGHRIVTLYLSACDVERHQLPKLGRFVERVIYDPRVE